PPTRAGLLHDTDVARLAGLRSRLAQLRDHAVPASKTVWHATGEHSAERVVEFKERAQVSAFRLAEQIERGQSVSRWALYAADTNEWRLVGRGTTIGYARMENIQPTFARRLKLVVEDAVEASRGVGVIAYGA
ncbi:MAG: hypothetical protein M3Y64_08030, partial [Gemmatimonadota bacterium]|nr:hypothetical protein [Gemmatimonadota bacterium]